jgi:hypothetical protein
LKAVTDDPRVVEALAARRTSRGEADMKRSKSVNLVVVPLLAAGFLSGCGGEQETAYCVDPNNVVTENSHCDRADDPGYFWFFGGPGLTRGSYAPGGERINSTDTAALARRGRATGKTIGGGFFSGGS